MVYIVTLETGVEIMTEHELWQTLDKLVICGNQIASMGVGLKISLTDWSRLAQIEQVVDLAKTTIDCLRERLATQSGYVRE